MAFTIQKSAFYDFLTCVRRFNIGPRMTLTTALIQCYFDYSCSSWYSSLGKGMIKKLQVVQNEAVRFVLDLGPRSRINCAILDKVNMLSVTDRIRQLRINHVFNIFHGHAREYLCENFDLNNNLTRGATNFNLLVPSGNTCNKNSFVYDAILDWNNLPIKIKNISNKPAFKSAVKKYLK